MSVVETLSRPSPPYASGTSAPSRPIAAALRSSSTIRPSFLCSSSSARGTTSPAMNSSVVCPICRCSSLKSSGMKTSPGARSSTRKLPPRIRFSVATVAMASFLSGGDDSLQSLDVVGGQAVLFGALEDALEVEAVGLETLAHLAGQINLGGDLVAVGLRYRHLAAAVVLGDAFEAVERFQLLLRHPVEHAVHLLALGGRQIGCPRAPAGNLVEV